MLLRTSICVAITFLWNREGKQRHFPFSLQRPGLWLSSLSGDRLLSFSPSPQAALGLMTLGLQVEPRCARDLGVWDIFSRWSEGRLLFPLSCGQPLPTARCVSACLGLYSSYSLNETCLSFPHWKP